MKRRTTVDFETHAIGSWPDTYPAPVGVAILPEGGPPTYLAWGHAGPGNNITEACAADRLRQLYRNFEIVFHNGMFDLGVGSRHLGLPHPAVFHDTQVLTFLYDPNLKHLALKEVAAEILGIAPVERDELKDWILENIPAAKAKSSRWAAYIAQAPGSPGRALCLW